MRNGFKIFVAENEIKSSVFFEDKYDSFVVKNESLEIAIQGVILNKKELMQTHRTSDFTSFFVELYKKSSWSVIKELEGEFSGYIIDRIKQRLFVFTNPTATQKVFYYKENKNIFFDTSLVRLSQSIKEKNILISPDLNVIYELIAFGNVLLDHTPIKNVKKIMDGNVIILDLNDLMIHSHSYFEVTNLNPYSGNKKDAVDQLNYIFRNGIKLEYEKDIEFGMTHFSLLSGGLDSRMSVLTAVDQGYKPDDVFCFSQSDYFDQTISQKIAIDYGLNYSFVPLDGGEFLKKIDELTTVSEGCSLYTGGIHVYHAFEKLKTNSHKIIHSGLSGDTILGGFVSEPKKKKPDYKLLLVNKTFLYKIENRVNVILNSYESEEIFLLRNRTYNRIVLGSQVLKNFNHCQTSAFMTKDFTQFALSLPENWKYNHEFYFLWLNTHCKESSKYLWEKTLTKPNALWKKKWGEMVNKKIYKAYVNYILKKPELTSMYPYQVYYKNSKDIQNYYDNYFKDNIWRLEHYPELKSDVEFLFTQKDFFQKSQAVNVLAIFKLFFN